MRQLLRSAACGFTFSFRSWQTSHLTAYQHKNIKLFGTELGCIQRSSRSRKRTSQDASDAENRDSFSESDLQQKQKAGKVNNQLQRSVRREGRIAALENMDGPLSLAEQKEFDGLMKAGLAYEEQYCPSDFSDSHVAFKAAHNQVFINLIQYCQSSRKKKQKQTATTVGSETAPTSLNIFYLDGPDAATTFALNSAGFNSDQYYIANRHGSTCDALRKHLPDENVVHASAADALAGTGMSENETANIGHFGDIPFSAYYFDGCGGYIPLIIDMMSAAFDRDALEPPIAVGFSVLGGNRDVVDKELDIIRKLVSMVKRFGIRVDHVLDDPERYGISSPPCKIYGGTLTTWCILEKDCRDS
mmetsp:Transcript_25190/g.37074  ORF Transcript_25190/g.37074 Transcript_25190/m.37074 type:complete len:359 (-) Transcript_25190:34-1110(-)